MCLLNYDTMQVFGLRILSVLTSCLDTLLYLQEYHDIIAFLLQCQSESKIAGRIVVDESTIERNQILVRCTVLGEGTSSTRNRPNREILMPDWLITSHVT